MEKDAYVDSAWRLQLLAVRDLVVLEVQLVLEDLDAHRNQSLVALVALGVQEVLLLTLLLDPEIKRQI